MSQYVSGKTVPRADVMRFLAYTLQVEEEWLAGMKPEDEKTEETEECSMREFKKSSKLDHVLYDVRGPVVEAAMRREEAGTNILKLNIGNPAS